MTLLPVPFAHGTQVDCELAPSAALAVRAGQSVQTALPRSSLKEPAAHALHAEASLTPPRTVPNLPAGHSPEHATAPSASSNAPVAHGAHGAPRPNCALALPRAHLVGADTPARPVAGAKRVNRKFASTKIWTDGGGWGGGENLCQVSQRLALPRALGTHKSFPLDRAAARASPPDKNSPRDTPPRTLWSKRPRRPRTAPPHTAARGQVCRARRRSPAGKAHLTACE